ncbi:MAG TPA: protease inhibitor I42 family protein [Candidatus Acidoferrum sp.]|nr:protease inhibitor I42 family protein [Candidatus Acidoferrum sp.]
MDIYDDPNVCIVVKVCKSFAISLESNPTTGYTWRAEYDSSFIDETKSSFTPISQATGSVGKEMFEFQTKRVGVTFITMRQSRSWETEIKKTLIFKVDIKS